MKQSIQRLIFLDNPAPLGTGDNMSEVYRFFPSIAEDRLYTASQVNEYLYETLEEENGVLQLPATSAYADELAVTNDATLSVDIAAGACVKAGALYMNTASLHKALTTVTSGSLRIDRIVIRTSVANRNMVATIVAGTETTGTPAAPAIVDATDVLLAQILVDRSTGTYAYTVTDEREFRPYLFVSDDAIATAIHGSATKSTLAAADEFAIIDTADSNNLKKIPFSSLAASTGIPSATKFPKALGADLVALITAAGYTLNPATGTASLDGIADGTTYKRILAAVATALNASTIVAGTQWGSGNDGNGGVAPKAKTYVLAPIKAQNEYVEVVPPAGSTWIITYYCGTSGVYGYAIVFFALSILVPLAISNSSSGIAEIALNGNTSVRITNKAVADTYIFWAASPIGVTA